MKKFRDFFSFNRTVLVCGTCAIAVTVAATVLLLIGRHTSQALRLSDESSAEATAAIIETAAEAVPETPVPTATADGTDTLLQVTSDGTSFTVTVTGLDGAALTGHEFNLRVQAPDGTENTYRTSSDARLALQDLAPGSYTITMLEQDGFRTAWPVLCTLAEKLDYVPIANITQVVEVKDVSDVPVEETKPADQPVQTEPVRAEAIDTARLEEQTAAITEPEPVTDAQGNLTYTYTYPVGSSGCLLLADGSESDVTPVVENGKLSHGLRRVVTYLDSSGAPLTADAIPAGAREGTDYFAEESSEYVKLLEEDGLPVSGYQITAEPVYETPVVKTGWVMENGKSYFYDADGNPVTGLKNIDGKLYFFDTNGVKASKLGVDVSYFNTSVDWNQLKAQGVDFAIVRVAGRTWGSGVLFEDNYSVETTADGSGNYLQRARDAGLSIGAYVYSNAINTNEAVEEASLALEMLGGMALDYPIYIDMEYTGDYPNGRADQLTVAQRNEIVQAFCQTIESAGYRAGVYAGDYYWNTALSYSAVSNYSIWYANYTDHYTSPTFAGWNIWQFTAYGVLEGASGYIDMNIIY